MSKTLLRHLFQEKIDFWREWNAQKKIKYVKWLVRNDDSNILFTLYRWLDVMWSLANLTNSINNKMPRRTNEKKRAKINKSII